LNVNQGSLVAIYIARAAEAGMTPVTEVRAVPGKGLEGDRYFRGNGTFSDPPGTGQEVTLLAIEMLEWLERERGIQLRPEEPRRNLITKGLSLNDLVGKVFRVGPVHLKGIRLAEPCDHLQRLTQPGVVKGLLHRAGLRANILNEGILRVGDEIEESDAASGTVVEGLS
jgi:MOSC domain-containing protein YiiM